MANRLWPQIRKQLPDAELHIYGAYMPKEAKLLTDKTIGLHVKGPVDDHFKVMKKYRVNMATLR